jgi:hypothetical protein
MTIGYNPFWSSPVPLVFSTQSIPKKTTPFVKQ